ncbi:MAG: Dna2/Cas4 domain-containing protein, partial [Deltaproteobacteria bacterium]|nr:Dna2/Cas4 domain-containing protein [Deltaproteobacteria bacterium]
MYTEDDLIPLSALQHLLFCERQCALIHIEQVWNENLFTAEGRIMHERVHEANRESRGDIRIEYGMPLRSLRLGLIGKADVVEFHRKPSSRKAGPAEWLPFPVE